MKKQNLKSLTLNKKSISKLDKADITGGGTDDPRSVYPCPNDSSVVFCPRPCIWTVGPCWSEVAC